MTAVLQLVMEGVRGIFCAKLCLLASLKSVFKRRVFDNSAYTVASGVVCWS